MKFTGITRKNQPPPCPAAGSGVHTWLLSAANTLHHQGESETATASYLRAATATCGRPVGQLEIEDAVRKAFQSSWTPPNTTNTGHTRISHTRLKFDQNRLEGLAAKGPKVDADWLKHRSPVEPWNDGPFMLKHLYEPGDVIRIFDDMKNIVPKISLRMGDDVSQNPPVEAPNGVWFLCNPTDGKWHLNPRTGKGSCRSEESIIRYPYAVLESDTAPADLWLSALVQIPIPVVAIYTSGGRSIHALWRVDARSKVEWDETIAPFKGPLKVLGADTSALSAVRLTRLPGCIRKSTGKLQKLLYLNPDSTGTPLADLPRGEA